MLLLYIIACMLEFAIFSILWREERGGRLILTFQGCLTIEVKRTKKLNICQYLQILTLLQNHMTFWKTKGEILRNVLSSDNEQRLNISNIIKGIKFVLYISRIALSKSQNQSGCFFDSLIQSQWLTANWRIRLSMNKYLNCSGFLPQI